MILELISKIDNKAINKLYLNDYLCVGLIQSTILESVGCIWFNRSEAKDREIVARKYVQYNELELYISDDFY